MSLLQIKSWLLSWRQLWNITELLCLAVLEDVSAKARGGGAATLGGAHREEGAGFLRAHCGHRSFTLRWEGAG